MFDAVKLGDKFSFQHADPPDEFSERTPVRRIRRDELSDHVSATSGP